MRNSEKNLFLCGQLALRLHHVPSSTHSTAPAVHCILQKVVPEACCHKAILPVAGSADLHVFNRRGNKGTASNQKDLVLLLLSNIALHLERASH